MYVLCVVRDRGTASQTANDEDCCYRDRLVSLLVRENRKEVAEAALVVVFDLCNWFFCLGTS